MFGSAEARPMRSAAEVQKELEAREEARSRVKLIWRALAAMVSGIAIGTLLISDCLCWLLPCFGLCVSCGRGKLV